MSVRAYLAMVVMLLVGSRALQQLLTMDLGPLESSVPVTGPFVVRALAIPSAVQALVLLCVVALLRWWRPVFVDDRPVAAWIGLFPLILSLQVVVGLDVRSVVDTDPRFTSILLVALLLGAFEEELLFRGIGVTVFRANGYPEARVAVWTSVIFALSHLSNLATIGPEAFLQALSAGPAGYFLYLVRRWSGGLALPTLLHGLTNLVLIWPMLVAPGRYSGMSYAAVGESAMLGLAIVGWFSLRGSRPAGHLPGSSACAFSNEPVP